MSKLDHSELVLLLLQIGTMLVAGRLMAELARRFRQPAVAGELLAGILLGPSVLGHFVPAVTTSFFTMEGHVATTMDGLTKLAAILLLFIGGLEVDISTMRSQGRRSLLVSLCGTSLSFAIGYLIGGPVYHMIPGITSGGELVFRLFIGTAMAITALPVMVRILMDLNLFRTQVGMLIIASAMLDDVIGWVLFSVILGMIGVRGSAMPPLATLGLTAAFSIFMLTIGKRFLTRFLPVVTARLSWPGGLLSLVIALCFLSAAFTEAVGLHAVFGAFLVGITLGDSPYMTDRAKEIVHQFINNIFAPLFFVYIGIKLDFVAHFNLQITAMLLAGAILGKVIGAGTGALLGGNPFRISLAIGFAMTARGAMEIVLGLVALEYNIINQEVFVALVTVALVTTVTSGTCTKMVLQGIHLPIIGRIGFR